MFREIYWMFVVIELEGVYDVNRRHLLFYFRLRVSRSKAYCIALENQSFRRLFKNSMLLPSNFIAFALQTHCFYTLKAVLLLVQRKNLSRQLSTRYVLIVEQLLINSFVSRFKSICNLVQDVRLQCLFLLGDVIKKYYFCSQNNN